MAKKQLSQKPQKIIKHKQKVKAKKKGAKKGFYTVEAPMTSVSLQLYGDSLNDFDGKIVKLDLTKNLRGKNLILLLKVKTDGSKLRAEPTGVYLQGSYIRRSMRRGADYIEDSFICTCRDAFIQVKPFLITRKRVSRTIRKVLRNMARKNIIAHVKIRNSKEVISDVITNKMQKLIASKLKKIYPLALSEIRMLSVVGEKDDKDLADDSADVKIENIDSMIEQNLEDSPLLENEAIESAAQKKNN